ncbi:MAG: DNA-deoxyinosine glycosylase [Bacteroidales bacterium]|nr:DNA-deoxyinosine glycosylase [Bacteroidales bacterium]
MKSISFEPIINKNSKVLILGTMPGIKSLAENQYYAHPRNAFWKIMFQLFDTDFSENYEIRKKLILDNHLALWDTLKLCFREGSLDSNIKNEEANDIHELLKKHPKIHSIIFNGKNAEKFYKRYFKKKKQISYYCLSSTSPANARKQLDEKLVEWSVVLDLLKY